MAPICCWRPRRRNNCGQTARCAAYYLAHRAESRLPLPPIPLSRSEIVQLAAGRQSLLRAARQRGLRLSLEQDFSELAALNRQHRASWHALAPSFDPRHGGIAPDTAFWLRGIDADGEVVATQAARFYDFGSTSLGQHLSDLRLFYPAPAQQAMPGESCAAPAQAALLHGRTTLSGATWVAPAWRGRGLASILPRLSRLLALTRWQSDLTFSFVADTLLARGLAATYGYRNIAPGMRWLAGDGSVLFAGALVWLPRADLLQDLAGFCAQLNSAAPLGQHSAHSHIGDDTDQVTPHLIGDLGHLETIEQGVAGVKHMVDGTE